MEKYSHNLIENGYELSTLTLATNDDLIAVEIDNPTDRKLISKNISKLKVSLFRIKLK